MYNKKECVAMLLAGGQGSRLYALTEKIAKPAVSFGGKYRIIDFALSNCINSGIDTVGVLTQYQPLVLNNYIGNGQPWDLDRNHGGVFILPPYQKSKGSGWYSGTANAIYQNLAFIDRYEPEYVAILSGDHIYKMDYSKMLSFAKEKEADCTIAVIDVPIEEASRFGIMSVNNENVITQFQEKPEKPQSTLASMGVYIFKYDKLRKYLIENEEDKEATKDFGKNIIPKMLQSNEKMVAYKFDGYWKDVGTINSLWEANMDLLNPNIPIDLYDTAWKIYSRNPIMPPHFVGKKGKVDNSIITEGTDIEGVVSKSLVFDGVIIEKGAKVKNSIIMPGSQIKSGAIVEYSIVGENSIIGEESKIGAVPKDDKSELKVAVVGNNIKISPNKKVLPAKIISEDM